MIRLAEPEAATEAAFGDSLMDTLAKNDRLKAALKRHMTTGAWQGPPDFVARNLLLSLTSRRRDIRAECGALASLIVLLILHIWRQERRMSVTSKIRKQGGAAIMTIPPALLKLMAIDIGAQVTLTVEDGKLIANPVVGARKRYSLAELLQGSEAMQELSAEVAWAREGAPVGREIV
jgi:antitoxin ChpS